MTVEWNTEGDFSAIVDAAEPLVLVRQGTTTELAIAKAWRYSRTVGEVHATGGAARQDDVIWQFEWNPSEPFPSPGDRLIDSDDNHWAVLAVEPTQGNTRLRCTARDMRMAYGLDALVNVEQAVWEDLGGGLEITGWTLYRPSVHARIQPEAVTVDEETSPVSSMETFKVYFEESIPLDHNHRLVAGDGTAYRLLSYTQADRIDVLPVATVRREVV